eukprot:4134851-Pyramimonas_sp.AAC.1
MFTHARCVRGHRKRPRKGRGHRSAWACTTARCLLYRESYDAMRLRARIDVSLVSEMQESFSPPQR